MAVKNESVCSEQLSVFFVCLFFHVSGQKSHHQNYEDVHGEVCHGEFLHAPPLVFYQ